MKTKRIVFCYVITVGVLIGAGCSSISPRRGHELESSVPKLTTAIVAEVCDTDSGCKLSEDQLVENAMKGNPEFKRTFHDLKIKVKHNNEEVVVLICTPDGKYALIEDASWTLGVDRKWYLSKTLPPAEFTIDFVQEEKKKP
jgi:hypothetical protein